MQFSRRGQPAPLGVLYDSSLDGGIDQVLALAMLFGFAATAAGANPVADDEPIQPAERSVPRCGRPIFFRRSRRRLRSEQDSAADWDGLDRKDSRVGAADGVGAAGETRRGRHPRLCAWRGEAERHGRSVALIRNALTAQVDQNGAVILAGLPANLLALLALPGGKDWAAKKARVLTHCRRTLRGKRRRSDRHVRMLPGYRKLLAEWPGRIVMAGAELNEALPFPAEH